MVDGQRIAKLREKRGLSQAALADKLGVSQATVAMWESNKRKVTDKGITLLADFFNVSTDYLYGRDVPKWASTDDVTDLERVLKLNDTLEYRGEKISNEDREKLLRVIEAIFWEQREEERD